MAKQKPIFKIEHLLIGIVLFAAFTIARSFVATGATDIGRNEANKFFNH